MDSQLNSFSIGLMSNDGFIQTAVHGTGTVIASSPGPVEILDLKNERLTLDGAYAVARSAALKYTVQKSTRSLFGAATSGQGFVQVIEGTGRVYLSPVPNQTVALQEVIVDGVRSAFAPKKK